MTAVTGEADPTRKAELRDALRLSLVGATVTVESGPDQGLSAKVGAAGLIVGTGSAADLCLSDPLVSRKHLELRARPDGLLARDLGSLNGTFLEGHRVFELLLTGSEKLTLGETTLGIALVSEGQKLGISPKRRFGRAIGESEAMRHVFELLQKAADSDVTVLLEGESGTGKDVLANALHEESARRDGPLVVVDCGAIAESLIESELFGHEKGAFTGAHAARARALEQDNGGTLF